MSQHDMNIANQGFPAFRADLNSALGALATTSAGATEPTTMFAQQLWYDSTANLLKMRNTDNDAWITLAYFDQTTDEWEVRSAVVQAVDSAGVSIKTDDGTTRLIVDDSGNVGIGTSSPARQLHIESAVPAIRLFDTTENSYGEVLYNSADLRIRSDQDNTEADSTIIFDVDGTERMRILSDGKVGIGDVTTTSLQNSSNSGNSQFFWNNVYAVIASDDQPSLIMNRQQTDGALVFFRKDGTNVGQLNSFSGDLSIGTGDTGLRFLANAVTPYNLNANTNRDNAIDLGIASIRYDDIYATNGTIQTSDEREKQDVAELSEAERNVAVAAKGLLRKYRWIDAVEEKGDDARIHFGIIAQDLKAAFEAEGLDAGRYAMFIHSEWWETSTEVPAVEAVDAVYETQTDEEGNETQVLVSEAVEAKEAYTRIDTYETEAEAPEDAIKKDRMGIRYPELLAFIIAAI